MIQRHLLHIQKVLKRRFSKLVEVSEATEKRRSDEVDAAPEVFLAAETLPFVAHT